MSAQSSTKQNNNSDFYKEVFSNHRPPLYKTPESLEEKISKYFKKYSDNLTITGLCLYCGFASRQSFYAYEKKKDFSYTIKRARCMIENSYEIRLRSQYSSGAIFALKNFGWIDNQAIEHKFEDAIVIVERTNGKNGKKKN